MGFVAKQNSDFWFFWDTLVNSTLLDNCLKQFTVVVFYRPDKMFTANSKVSFVGMLKDRKELWVDLISREQLVDLSSSLLPRQRHELKVFALHRLQNLPRRPVAVQPRIFGRKDEAYVGNSREVETGDNHVELLELFDICGVEEKFVPRV